LLSATLLAALSWLLARLARFLSATALAALTWLASALLLTRVVVRVHDCSNFCPALKQPSYAM
jgi:hypothetical protein